MKLRLLTAAIAAMATIGCDASPSNQMSFIAKHTPFEMNDFAGVISADYYGFPNGDFFSAICIETEDFDIERLSEWHSRLDLELINTDTEIMSSFRECIDASVSDHSVFQYVRNKSHVGDALDGLDIYVFDPASGRLYNGAFQN